MLSFLPPEILARALSSRVGSNCSTTEQGEEYKEHEEDKEH